MKKYILFADGETKRTNFDYRIGESILVNSAWRERCKRIIESCDGDFTMFEFERVADED